MNEEQHINKWTAALKADDAKARIEAVLELAKLGNFNHFDVLVTELSNSNWSIRAEAVRTAGRIGAPSFIQPLNSIMGEDVLANRNTAIYAMQKIGTTSVIPLLVERLMEQNSELREDVFTALYRIAGKSILPVQDLEDERQMDRQLGPSEAIYKKAIAWWDKSRFRFDSSKVYILGEPASPGVLIEAIRTAPSSLPDAYIRLLEDYTGVHFEVKPMKTFLRDWDAWWKQHQQEYIPGVKYFYGHRVTGNI